MVKKNKSTAGKPQKLKLTRDEKRRLKALMRQRQQESRGRQSAQETIPYLRMWPDGICRVTGKLIPKERLRLVPHATLTVEAKEMLAKKGRN